MRAAQHFRNHPGRARDEFGEAPLERDEYGHLVSKRWGTAGSSKNKLFDFLKKKKKGRKSSNSLHEVTSSNTANTPYSVKGHRIVVDSKGRTTVNGIGHVKGDGVYAMGSLQGVPHKMDSKGDVYVRPGMTNMGDHVDADGIMEPGAAAQSPNVHEKTSHDEGPKYMADHNVAGNGNMIPTLSAFKMFFNIKNVKCATD